MKKYIIDRFEGSYAICEDENKDFVNIERDLLPPEAKESDYLIMNEDDTFSIDIRNTEDRKQDIRRKLDSLFE